MLRDALLLFDGERAWLVPRERILELKGLAASCSVLFRDAAGGRSALALPLVGTASGHGRARTRSAPLFRSLEKWLETGDLIRLDAVRQSAFVVAGAWVETIIVGHASLLLVCGILSGAASRSLAGAGSSRESRRPRWRTQIDWPRGCPRGFAERSSASPPRTGGTSRAP